MNLFHGEKKKLVTLIVPCRNEEKYIGGCLESILSQDYPQEKIEILVINGMSEDSSRDIVRGFAKKFSNITILDNPKRISASALNIGVQKSQGKIIMKMDAHVRYESDYISKCVEYLEKKKVDCVGGPIRPRGNNFISRTIAYAYQTPFGSGGGKFHDENYQGYTDTVYLGAYRREVFEEIGLFDEKLVASEDDDFNFRLRQNKGKLYLTPEIKSYYYVRPTLKRLWTQYFRYGYWKVFFMKKHHILGAWHHIVPSIFISSLASSFLLGFISWPFLALFILILVTYLSISLSVSLKICLKQGLKYFAVLPLVFAIIHFSYGTGFLKGIFNAFLIKK